MKAHLPRKGGDQPSLRSLRKLKYFQLCEGVHVNVISPLAGEMGDSPEGGK
jgi:hypothetical protein